MIYCITKVLRTFLLKLEHFNHVSSQDFTSDDNKSKIISDNPY
jgi:hypothetical protein